jgi:hypothetical protein
LAAEPLENKLKWIVGPIIASAVLASFPVTGASLSPIGWVRHSTGYNVCGKAANEL